MEQEEVERWQRELEVPETMGGKRILESESESSDSGESEEE